MSYDQLALLLWKNYIVRKRQPGILALIFVWPILVFMIVYTVRDNVDPEYHPTCHFPSRSMPQDGLLPFVQNYICNIGNPCDLLSEYEEVPTFSNASLGPLVVDMQPILNNDTILSAVKTLPKSIQLLKSMAEILTRPEIKTLFDRGIRLGDLFSNHDRIKSLLKAQIPRASPSLIDGLFESSIRLYYLVETFGSTNIDGIICSTENLKKYMILTNEEDYGEISKILCQLDANQIPDILSELSKHLNFNSLLAMLDRVMGKFRSYDFFQDLKHTVEIILNLKSIDKYVPSYLKIREWLPNAIMLFRNVTFKEIDLNFIKKLVDLLDPILEKENDWITARHGFLNLNILLEMVKTFLHNRTLESSNDIFSVLDNMSRTIKDYSLNRTEEIQITKILDMTFVVLKDGIILTEKLLNYHADQISLTAEVIDKLKYLFSDNIINTLTYASSLIENIVRMTHHVAIIHLETLTNIYDICKNHQEVVGKILTNIDPMVYQNMLQSFSRLDLLERLVTDARGKKMEEFLCEKNIFNEIFGNDHYTQTQLKNIEDIICSDSGKKFVADIYGNFHFQQYGKIINNTLSTLVSMFFKNTYGIEKTNLTTVVKVTRDFVSYLQSPIRDDPDWSIFKANENWSKVIENTRGKGRLDILGMHLSIAKIYGSHSLSYFSIIPNLENMYKLSKIILRDLEEQPIDWIDQFRNNKYKLVESFYLTVTDKEKTLKILEYSNFTKSYCINSNPPNLIVFPIGSDDKLLKKLICRVSKSVENALMINITNVKFYNDQDGKKENFDWTWFNDKVIQIYKYIDDLLFQEDKNYDLLKLQYLKSNFKTAWTTNLTSKEAWEISVGVLCKLFDVMENTLFNIQVKSFWTNIYAIAWSSSVIFESIDTVIKQIRKNDHMVKLSDLSLPETRILLESLMANLSPIILDGVDLISLSFPIHLITAIDEYKNRETNWPCVKNESIGTVLEFRNGSQSFIRELERIACEPAIFIKEWRDHPVLMKARRILQNKSNVTMPAFDWTLGYIKFRHLVKDFDNLISDIKDIVLYENPKLVPYIKALEPELEKIFEQRLPNMKNKARGVSYYIDLELDKTIKVFQSNVTMYNLWESKITVIDKLLVLGKFLSHVLHETLSLVTNILQDESQDISLLSMLGFDNESVIGLIYNKLPYILSTIVNGLSDERIENKIIETLKNGNKFECKDAFDWWSDVNVGLSVEEYSKIEKFVCNLDPENFNAYMDFVVGEEMVFRKPVNQYRLYTLTLISDLYDFVKSINARINSTVIIKKPFTKLYFEDLVMKLKDSLEYIESTSYKIVELNTERIDHKLIIEGISKALVNIAEALQSLEIKNDQIYIWQAVKTGDIQQLLKIFESSPEETIALIFRLLTLDKKNGQFLPYEKLRATFCDPHFVSDYWTKKDRNYFLMNICAFDPYQVLKSITSIEFYETVEGKQNVLIKSTPLSSSLIKLLDALTKIISSHDNIIVRSNIFNSTTWKNLSLDTWDVIKTAEASWVYKIIEQQNPPDKLDKSSKSLIMHNYPYVKIIKSVRLLNFLTDLLSGGDIWQKFRNAYENSKIQPILTLIEDMPNLVLTGVDTFLTSERLNDFAEKLFLGKVKPCDIDRYLIPPSFVRKKALLSSISNFCLNVLEKFPTALDFLSLDVKTENNLIASNDKVKYWNESYFVDVVNSLVSTLTRVSSEGYKNPKVPTWWTSFEEGSLKGFSLQYKKKDLRTLAHSVVNKLGNVVKDLMKTSSSAKNCSWCSTLMIDIVNSQLSRHALYTQIICDINKLNNSEIHNRFIHEFYWNKTASMINNYNYLNDKKTLNEFITSIEATLHYIADIIVDFQNGTYNEKINHCVNQLIGEPAFSRPGLYITILTGILDILERNTFLLDTSRHHQKILNLTNLAEKHVPIWKPLVEVVKTSDKELVNNSLPNAMINVNAILNNKSHSLCRTISECKNPSVLYEFLSSKRAGKVLRYDPKVSKYPSAMDISNRLAKSLNLSLIRENIIAWRRNVSWDLTWLKQILRHLSVVLSEGGHLLDIAFKTDFQDISNIIGMPDIFEGVVNLLKDKTIDKIFSGMRETLEDVEPFLDDRNLIDDLNSMIDALESMEIFKNLGLLDVKYVVSDMFDNWDTVRTYLIDKINLSKETASILSQAKIDMISVFMKERRALSLKDTICLPSKLGNMLNVHHAKITIEEISTALCTLNDTQTQNIAITLIKNLNFDYILKTLLSANVKNILANANLTETEGKLVLDNLGIVSELVPFFKDKLSGNLISAESLQSETDGESNAKGIMSSLEFLSDSSKMLCGKTILSTDNRFYKIVASIQDNIKEDDKVELDSLPTDFCRETYKSVINMGAGKIIWSYIKPLLRGLILYAPDTIAIKEIMSQTNDTFVQMDHFGQLMNSFVETLKSLASLTEMGDSLNELQDILASEVMQIAIKSFGGENFEGNFSEFNFGEIAWKLKRSKKLITMVEMLNDLLDCVLIDRMKGFSTENELETYARSLMKTNEFLAGIVFLNKETERSKRSFDYILPDNITYKIRMDVDYVPSTTRLKNQFWIPGPESNFIEDLRYLRGFIQIQDAVDRAIIKVKSQKDQKWKTLTQQMPYPCWKHISFQTTLYESQGLQVCFFFALMMCVGSAVRHIVWERESRNSMVMSVMGLKFWQNTFAWFITSFIELSIVIICISLILLGGKILPKSDPILVLMLLFDYVFSIVMFCYMISTIFSSASLSAITTVVMFLLTYMPYIIVIAMEATFRLAYKLLICLSMSTSFCYGCLYIVRKEVQGTGLTWENMWEESSPGDPMSFCLILFMTALDGCIYALIGYFITKYTNSEDDSDVSSLTVNEKQIGVRFDNVRKVYNTDVGEVVAVDEVTLKLREGEVTSLLGRNGAGKTTLIKMLTGMVAPTNGEICLNGEEGCKPEIGVCPQDNVLIDTLTPREHMIFYSKLKGKKDNVTMERNVNEMLSSLELGRQEHEPVYRLSGGTKRRLCVALAFLGSPKLVILDEPGAGVDPAARRRIWQLIDQHRIGRTVLLSTHHLDEADMLSDTVVVMHKGKILCTGSPLTLKMNHGRGYRLHISYPPNGISGESIERKNLETLQKIIEGIVANCSISETIGTEVIISLPFQGKHGNNNDIAQAIKVLEDNQKLLGFLHFSLECDTLERVFLDLCARTDNTSTLNQVDVNNSDEVNHIGLSIDMLNDGIDSIDFELSGKFNALRQIKALLKKRLWHFAKDWRSPLATFILPTLFVAVAMGFSLIRPPSVDEPPLALNPRIYDTHPTYFYSIDNSNDPFLQHVSLQLHDRFGDDYAGAWQTLPNDTGTCECMDGQQTCQGLSQAVEGLLQTLPGRPTLDWIVSTHQEYIERRYGGWSLSHWKEDPLFVVWYNNKGHHSMPSYLNALNEAILRASGVNGHLTTLNHPLKLSSDQLNRTTLLQRVADVGIALVLLLAFNLVAAQGTKELVRERLSEEKRILYLAGVHPVTYWTTALIWDFLIFGCSICLAVVVFEIFGLSTYVSKDNLPGVCLLLFLFAWAAIPFSHLAEKAFDDSSLSNMVLFCVNTFIGVSSLATILVIDILGKSQAAADARDLLHRILMIFPQYVLGDALVELSKNDIAAELLKKFHMDTYKSPLGWDLLGIHYVFLIIIGVLLFITNLIVECRFLPNFHKQNVNYEVVQEDEDVIAERSRIEGGIVHEDILKTIRLRKEYRSVYGTNVAVQNLTFGVQSGKCFGLLGVNGAGKSTVFKMLTTEVIATAGRIVLNEEDIDSGPLCNGEIGYCPQTDALDGFLTPHQCLTVHAEIYGLKNVPKAVESMLRRFDLLKYAHQRVSNLSGGNKRKLCTAIAVIAPVSVILMDEPTSGLDPATKDLVGCVIKHVTKNHTSVILTSHSVADCESLCSRVGILAKAGLRCIGTPQHLKHKFGEGYVAFLRFSQPNQSNSDLKRAIANHLSQAVVSSRQATAIRLLVPKNEEIPVSMIFDKVRMLAEELKSTDYTLSQSSLDQVLVNFSEELDDESIDSARNGFNNVYFNMDAIHMETLQG